MISDEIKKKITVKRMKIKLNTKSK
jgi:hypothetical protein